MSAPRWVVASSNRHKVAELREMLVGQGVASEVVGLDAWDDAPEVEETAQTFEGNACLKVEGVAAWLAQRGEPSQTRVLGDDSGICVEALDGRPGVYSARFSGPSATDVDNNRRLVEELGRLGLEHSPAHYVCVLAFGSVAGGDVRTVRGRWDVEVRTTARGSGGFGYDPHAWLDGGARTVAELDRASKAKISHRGQALRRLLEVLGALPAPAPTPS